MDGGDGDSVVEGADFAPRFSLIGSELEVGCPAAGTVGGFVAGRAEDIAVRELDGFIFDGAEEAVGEASGWGPRGAAVVAGFEFAPPFFGAGADFVEEHEGAVVGLEEHGIPGGESGSVRLDSVGGLLGGGPFSVREAGGPDADIGVAFAGAPEPSGDEAGW